MTTPNFWNRILMRLFTIITIACIVICSFFFIRKQLGAGRIEITESGMVQKITSMGKLELVKYSMKDIIEQKETHLILPDSKVVFLAVGEVTACIDLTKIKEGDIHKSKDTVTVMLPQPEICYSRLDHQRSRVYDITGAVFPGNAKNMVEDVYKLAEQKLTANADQMNLLGMARQNAQILFKPLLEGISGKTVVLQFKQR